MSTNPDSLATLARVLRAQYDGRSPAYPKLYIDVISGRLPATRRDGRWYWQEEDLPQIAAYYGLHEKTEDAPQAA